MTTDTSTEAKRDRSEATGLHEFRVTFGQKYPHEPHPYYDRAHRDGFVAVLAPDYHTARAYVVARLGSAWSNLYDLSATDTDWGLFPFGELDRWLVPSEFASMLGGVS